MTEPLRILQILRAPVGGLFRHVQDLTRELSARGHQVGIVALPEGGHATLRVTCIPLLQILQKREKDSRCLHQLHPIQCPCR